MRPLLHPQLVNPPFGDPGLYVEFMFEKRALLFDLGDLQALAPRKVLRVSHVFVSHTHMDHFMGFDHLLRLCLGRDRRVELSGPPGLVDQVGHKLAAYTWNLVHGYDTDFTLVVNELHPDGSGLTAEFHCLSAFRRENQRPFSASDGVLLDEDAFQVRATFLDHKIPCLAFVLEEKQHVNVWKNRLVEHGLPVGPWLRELKAAVTRGEPDDFPFRVWWRERGRLRELSVPLGRLKADVLRVVPGQKIGYVVDAVYHEDNARRIVELTRDADFLFIEATFLDEDAARAADKFHLTAGQAGRLGRAAGAKRLIPFHFSPKYIEQEARLRAEVAEAFAAPT